MLAPPPWQSLNARLRRDAVQCCAAMLCYAKPCCAMLRYAMMCSWERAHRCATGPLTRASRAGVALRASVATRPPQRWNGLPEDARVCATARLSSASRVQYGRCIAALMVFCRTRRARRSRCARRPPCYAVPCYGRAHSCATGPLTRASRAGVALRASVATRPPQRWKGPPEERASAQRILPDKISGTPRIMICVRGAPCELRMTPEHHFWHSEDNDLREGRALRLADAPRTHFWSSEGQGSA